MTQTPQAIEHFKILRVLGRGGMGVVYLALDERLQRNVALKVLTDYELPDEERRARFQREARAAAGIRHPNVATIYEVGESSDGVPFIAMEYCEGPTLAQILRQQALNEDRFLRIGHQIADGLAAAHAKGVVHRDIKTSNIIVEREDVVKILDFGLARLAHTDMRTRSSESISRFFGTVPYISPEQGAGKVADERSDLFSIGVVFYEMATGFLPFDGETPFSILEKIRNEEPAPFIPFDSAFSQRSAAIITKLLQKDPRDRYETAGELVHDLQAAYSSLPTARQTLSSMQRSSLGSTRRFYRNWLTVALPLLLLVVVAIGLVAWGRREQPRVTVSQTKIMSPQDVKSVAVLPFRNVSGDARDDFLSVGLADSLITHLGELQGLQVRPTSAVIQYQKKPTDARTAGREQQVDAVLEGHFITSADDVRVNLQLTNSQTGYGIWSKSVDGKRNDLISLIDSVAAQTERSMEKQAAGGDNARRSEPHTANAKAFEEYLRARSLIGALTPSTQAEQIGALRHAVELDPQFAAAYADLAIAMSLSQIRGYVAEGTGTQTAEWYARQAVRLDPNLPDAHLALGRTLVRYPDRFRESARENLAALRLDPSNSQALFTLVSYLISTGDISKIDCATKRFIDANPSSLEVKTRGYWNINAVDPEGALQLSQEALATPETALAGHDIRGLAYLILGNVEAAATEQRAAEKLVPNHYIGKSLAVMVAAGRGDRAAADRAVATMKRDIATNHWAALRVALAYAHLGDKKESLRYIHQAVTLGDHTWWTFVKHPWFADMQNDPEFQDIVSKMKSDLDDVRDDVVGVYNLICPQSAQ